MMGFMPFLVVEKLVSRVHNGEWLKFCRNEDSARNFYRSTQKIKIKEEKMRSKSIDHDK